MSRPLSVEEAAAVDLLLTIIERSGGPAEAACVLIECLALLTEFAAKDGLVITLQDQIMHHLRARFAHNLPAGSA